MIIPYQELMREGDPDGYVESGQAGTAAFDV